MCCFHNHEIQNRVSQNNGLASVMFTSISFVCFWVHTLSTPCHLSLRMSHNLYLINWNVWVCFVWGFFFTPNSSFYFQLTIIASTECSIEMKMKLFWNKMPAMIHHSSTAFKNRSTQIYPETFCGAYWTACSVITGPCIPTQKWSILLVLVASHILPSMCGYNTAKACDNMVRGR